MSKKDTASVVEKFTKALKGSGAIDVPALQASLLKMIGGEHGLAKIVHDGYENAADEPHVQARYVEMMLNVLLPKDKDGGDNLNTASDEDLKAVLADAANSVTFDEEELDDGPSGA